jgi:hypothetical protein
VNQAILAWSFKKKIYSQTTKPILLDSLHITAAVYSESSNIGLVVYQYIIFLNDQANIA